MRIRTSTLFILTLGLMACQPQTDANSTATTTEPTTEITATPNPESPATTTAVVPENTEPIPAPVEEAPMARSQRSVAPASPIDQRVEMTKAVLGPLCQNQYGCLEEEIYPLGWSEEGKFAYLLAYPSEAVENYRLTLFIQDMLTDKIVEQREWEANKQPGNKGEQEYDFSFVWENQRNVFRKVMEEHAIQEGTGNQFYRLPYKAGNYSYAFASNNTKVVSDYTGGEIIRQHQLLAKAGNLGQKRILRQDFGKYDLVLNTHALGLFKSPFEDRVAVVDAAEKRGYEGPPNVLKIMVVGCELEQGF